MKMMIHICIVERIHQQRSQYEYLVQWVGYDDYTWEIPDNIPDQTILEYENATTVCREMNRAPYSLQPSRKLTAKQGFIKTL